MNAYELKKSAISVGFCRAYLCHRAQLSYIGRVRLSVYLSICPSLRPLHAGIDSKSMT